MSLEILMKFACAASLLAPSVAFAQPSTATVAGWRLTPGGLGPVRIGMARDEVNRLLGVRMVGDSADNAEGCQPLEADRGFRGFFFTFDQANRLATISARAPARVATPRGIRVGSTIAALRRAYGPVTTMPRGRRGWAGVARLQIDWTDFREPEYVYWQGRDRGIRFRSGNRRTIEQIEGGNALIRLDSGCV